MAAISGITAVRPTLTTKTALVVYGATIAAGQPLYLDASDNEYKLTDSNSSSATAALKAIAMTPGIDGGYGLVAISGSIILVGTTMLVGESYYAGATAGTIVPDADLTTGDYISRVGVASSATQILLAIEATGIVHA
jgi:hypothetical protein